MVKNLSIIINRKELEKIYYNLQVFDVTEFKENKDELFRHFALLLKYSYLKEE